jgi:thiamine biosynthesis lipoprotein
VTRHRAEVRQVMGMPVSVHLRGDVDSPAADTAVQQVYAQLRKTDDVFSLWRDDTELARLRRGELAEEEGHPWLVEVRELCERARTLTEGLFDADVDGYDPTGLVKGWAVESAARHLANVPGVEWCVNAAGDLAAGAGRASVPGTWRVGIEDPRDRRRIAATVPLSRGGLATSGNSARGAHIRDPRSGAAVRAPGSATVLGPSLLWADVWATALFVDPVLASGLLQERAPAYASLVL